ncbi:hypothetical protein JYG23_08705 [Sedimentibacter sp. zth1]|uniref:hypothetical protein n=1 Tax=Sedimentibacter sp. zth1 TaxID=2816908 RepID=UPI001A91E5EE|nr:hypothetical protein [Sedimentibacter sp. zth1]QSX04786.1 hypothetical protein JYG23_08705 [Sedimentibacter sp. zth1]
MEQDKNAMLQAFNFENEEDELKKISYERAFFKKGKIEIFDSKIIDDAKAKLLGIFVTRFIILHELGHILNGHCKLCKL